MHNVTEEIRRAVKALYRTGETVEVRAFAPDGTRRVGRYTVGWNLVKAIEKENSLGRDTYYVLNSTGLAPIPIASGQQGSGEKHILWRRHFLLDFDPIRENKLATDKQYEAALAQATKARDFIRQEIGVMPLMASSGNGVHLLVPVDMPNDEASKDAIKKFQRIVAHKFNTSEVECECFADSARLVRAYGTKNFKGTETESLKWRTSGLL